MKGILLVVFMVIGFSVKSQHAPVPSYLVKQDFPDSVKHLPVESLDGKRITFHEMVSAFSGKTIVLDVWASWCRDCIVSVPAMNEMITSTAHKEKAFVYLSIDEDVSKWKAAIDRFKMEGNHFRLLGGWKNPLSNYIALDWVPRYMILNANGQIIHPKAITTKELEKLLVKDSQ
jgi:thiol-disulfide isomerase/thioredoxin